MTQWPEWVASQVRKWSKIYGRTVGKQVVRDTLAAMKWNQKLENDPALRMRLEKAEIQIRERNVAIVLAMQKDDYDSERDLPSIKHMAHTIVMHEVSQEKMAIMGVK